MAKVMITIEAPGEPPTLAGLRQRYNLRESEIDERFGVVEIDPQEHLYTVLVEASAAAKIQPGAGWEVQGPFSNPRVQPFGPPKG
jgi:hypothetical protein